MEVEFLASYIATGEQLEWGDILISNVSGKRYTFIEAVATNEIKVWDGTNAVYRTFYANHVFGIRTNAVKH